MIGRGGMEATYCGSNEELPPVYYSQLYVHKNSTYNTLQDLQGCTFAYNDDASLSGYHCLRFLLNHYASTTKNDEEEKKTMEITLPFFSRAICTGGHLSSIRAIALGNADVACIDCVIIQNLLARAAAAEAHEDDDTTTSCQHSSLWYFNQLRPLHAPPFVYTKGTAVNSTLSLSVQEVEPLSQQQQKQEQEQLIDNDGRVGPNPAQPIVVSTNIDIALRSRIHKAYLSLHNHTSLSAMNATLFVTVTPQHYEAIDTMMQECEGLDILCPNEGMIEEEDLVVDNNGDLVSSSDGIANITPPSSSSSSSVIDARGVVGYRQKQNVGHCYKSPSAL